MINKNDENYVYYLVAKNLKKQRKTKGLTQHKFAELCNYSDGFIMNMKVKNIIKRLVWGPCGNLQKY